MVAGRRGRDVDRELKPLSRPVILTFELDECDTEPLLGVSHVVFYWVAM